MFCFFGATGIFGLNKILDKKAGLIIDHKGITDHSNASNAGVIEWHDISGIRTKRIMFTQYLLIDLVNPEAYIERVKSPFKARLMRINLKMCR